MVEVMTMGEMMITIGANPIMKSIMMKIRNLKKMRKKKKKKKKKKKQKKRKWGFPGCPFGCRFGKGGEIQEPELETPMRRMLRKRIRAVILKRLEKYSHRNQWQLRRRRTLLNDLADQHVSLSADGHSDFGCVSPTVVTKQKVFELTLYRPVANTDHERNNWKTKLVRV